MSSTVIFNGKCLYRSSVMSCIVLSHNNRYHTSHSAFSKSQEYCKTPTMCAWQIHSYGNLEELRFTDSARIPKLSAPDDVLVKVLASSVNPIDVAMMGGYGSSLLNTMRQVERCDFSNVEFPMSLGRDFSGIVVRKGYRVTNLNIGDEVWGVIPPHYQGSHAERIIVKKSLVQEKPKSLSHLEAGSMLYTAMTAWSSLKITGNLFFSSAKAKKILVLGGSGGVGTMAVQLLKAWGSHVVATCRSDAVPLLESLGVDSVIDYTHPDSQTMIKECGKYDIILDAAGIGSEKGLEYAENLKDHKFSKYITLTSPLLRNVDQYGLLGGMMKNVVDLIVPNIKTNMISQSSTVRWGFFLPISEAMKEISYLVNEGKVLPMVEKVYTFNELPLAYQHVTEGHLRGKIVIDMQSKMKSCEAAEVQSVT